MCDISQKKFNFEALGKDKKGKGCFILKKLADVDLKVLEEIIKTSITLTIKKNQ